MESKLEIKQLAESEISLWDKLAEVSPQSTVFHTLVWLKAIEKYTNTKLMLLVGLDNEEIFAAIPFFYKKAGGFLKRLFSPPYNTLVPYLGPVFPYSDQWKQSKWESRLTGFTKELDDYINSSIGPDCVCISTPTNLQDIRGFLWTGYSASPNYTYVGDIRDKSQVWQGFSRSVRRKIEKAESERIEISESGADGYRFITESFLKDLRDDGIRLDLSVNYFLDLYESLQSNHFRVFISTQNGNRIGGLVVVTYKDTASFWLGGVRANLKGTYPNLLLYWKAIEWASEHGYRYSDLLGADMAHISAFKSGFNFDLRTFYDLRKSTAKYRLFVNGVTKYLTKA